MGYSIQNSETGELDYVHFDSSTEKRQRFDQETGEPSCEKLQVRYAKHKRFQIPKKYLRGTECEEFVMKMVSDHYVNEGIQVRPVADCEPAEPKQHYAREDYMNMDCVKTDIILAYNKDNYRLFLIPTLFCFSVYLMLLIVVLELFLHYWAHRSNALNMNKSYYYRSPLHVLTSHFCEYCRSESGKEIEILEMLHKQMRNAKDSKTLKDVSKAIS